MTEGVMMMRVQPPLVVRLCVYIRAASRILDQGGELEKCKRGEVIRIIAVQMNLADPRGGGMFSTVIL